MMVNNMCWEHMWYELWRIATDNHCYGFSGFVAKVSWYHKEMRSRFTSPARYSGPQLLLNQSRVFKGGGGNGHPVNQPRRPFILRQLVVTARISSCTRWSPIRDITHSPPHNQKILVPEHLLTRYRLRPVGPRLAQGVQAHVVAGQQAVG